MAIRVTAFRASPRLNHAAWLRKPVEIPVKPLLPDEKLEITPLVGWKS